MRKQVAACDYEGCTASNLGEGIIISLTQDLKTAESDPGTARTILKAGDYCPRHFVEAINAAEGKPPVVYRETHEGQGERTLRGDNGSDRARKPLTVTGGPGNVGSQTL